MAVDVAHDVLDWLTAGGTAGAAIVAALAVRQTGRQGRAQQQLLIDARLHDAAERRADFELGLLLELAQLVEGNIDALIGRGHMIGRGDELFRAKALLLALPTDLLPILRASLSHPIGDEGRGHPALDALDGVRWLWKAQDVLSDELGNTIASRRDLAEATGVSQRAAGRSWRSLWLARR